MKDNFKMTNLLVKSEINLISKFENFSKRISACEEYSWKIDIKFSLIAFFISIFLAFPSLWLYLQPDRAGRLFFQIMQAENPLNRDLPPIAQLLGYRIFVPSINYFLGLRGLFVIVIPILSSLINLFLLSKILRTRTNNNTFTLLNLIGLSLTWFIAEGTSYWGTTDSVSFLLLLIPAAYRVHPLYFVFAIPSSLFNDERSIFAGLFLLLFMIRRDYLKNNNSTYIVRSILFAFIGLFIWIFGRYLIQSGYIVPSPNIDIVTNQIPNFVENFREYWPCQLLNYISSFKWFFFFPLFLILSLKSQTSNDIVTKYNFDLKKQINLNLLVFLFYSALVMVNGDVWRSMSYSFFFIIESILTLYVLDKDFSVKLSYRLVLLMIITPVCFFGIHLTPQGSFPLPLVILRTFGGIGESFIPWISNFLS